MPRKGTPAKRQLVTDPVYGSPLVTALANKVLRDGKRSVAAGSGRFLARAGGTRQNQTGAGAGHGFRAEFRREAAVSCPPRPVRVEQ